jgi:hypothetical protein
MERIVSVCISSYLDVLYDRHLLINCLCDTHLQPMDMLVDDGPVDTGQVSLQVEGAPVANATVICGSFSLSVLQILSQRST